MSRATPLLLKDTAPKNQRTQLRRRRLWGGQCSCTALCAVHYDEDLLITRRVKVQSLTPRAGTVPGLHNHKRLYLFLNSSVLQLCDKIPSRPEAVLSPMSSFLSPSSNEWCKWWTTSMKLRKGWALLQCSSRNFSCVQWKCTRVNLRSLAILNSYIGEWYFLSSENGVWLWSLFCFAFKINAKQKRKNKPYINLNINCKGKLR